MLQAIRDRVMGIVGWIILGILIIAFAFFGLNSYLQSKVENYAARVNDVDIPLQWQQTAYQRLLQRMRASLGDAFRMASIDETMLRETALEQLVQQELLVQAADNSGFSASQNLLAGQIRGIEAFQDDGRFSKDRYERILRSQGMSEETFVTGLYREIMASHLESGVVNTASATAADLAAIWKLQAQQRRFDYMVLPAAGVSEQITVTDAAVQDYYNQHADRFVTDERLRIQYVQLDRAQIPPLGEVDEEAIRAHYEAQADRYVTPEERHARHILIIPASDSEEDVQAGLLRAQKVQERLQQGEDFGAVAGEVSEDIATAAAGGDLGFFARGIMDPVFEDAVFSMQPGETSDIVQSAFGFHIIELLEIHQQHATPLNEVRDELVAELQEDDRNEIFYEQSDRLAKLTFEQPDTLQPAADEMELELAESDWITRDGGADIAENAAVTEAAFSDDVLLNGNNSALIELEDGKVLVLRVVEHEAARQMTLDEARDQVVASLQAEQSRQLLTEQAGRLRAELEAGKPLQEIATSLGLEVAVTELLQRNSPTPVREILDLAFRMARPVDGDVIDGELMENGDYVLVALHEVRDGDLAALSDAERKQAWRSLNALQGRAEMQAIMDELRARAVIEIPDQDNL